jgi:hypothetical protein
MKREKAKGTERLNIYVHDTLMRRRIKMAAAQKDMSISEYCLQSIADQLAREEGISPRRNRTSLEGALEKARKFQMETFGGRTFRVSSAELIRKARMERNSIGKQCRD